MKVKKIKKTNNHKRNKKKSNDTLKIKMFGDILILILKIVLKVMSNG